MRKIIAFFKRLNGLTRWIGIFLTCISIFIGFANIKEEDISKFPKKIDVIKDTWNNYRQDKKTDEELSGVWKSDTDEKFKLDILVKNKTVDGIIQAKKLPPLFIDESLLVEGERKNGYLEIIVFDFIEGRRTEFAKMKVIYEDLDGISAHEVQTCLEVQTISQAKQYFPKRFIIEKTDERSSLIDL